MYRTLSSLPSIDTIPPPTSTSSTTTEAGKRQWETSHTSYVNWALGRLVARTAGSGGSAADGGGGGAATAAVDRLDAMASEIGTGDDLRQALEVVGNVNQALSQVERREQRERQQQQPPDDEEDDDRMRE